MKNPANRSASTLDLIAIFAVFALNAILFLTPALTKFYFAGYVDSNLGYLRDFSALIADGKLPYRDFPMEYPPLAALFLWLLAPFSGDFVTFRSVFMTIMIFMSAACWLAIRPVVEKQHRLPLLAAFLLAVASIGPIALVSFDYVPVFFTALTLLFLLRGNLALAGACLGAATALKGYPAVLLLPLAAEAWKRAGARAAALSVCCWAAALTLSLLPAIAADASGFIRSLTYHSERSLEIGSAYSAFLMPLKFAGAEFAANFDHGSWNLTGNPLADAAARVSSVILFAVVGIAWVKILIETLRPHPHVPTSPAATARLFALPIVAFMLGFKVGSPQFLLWLLPFVPLMAKGKKGLLLAALFILIGHCQQWIFPWHWAALVHLRTLPILVLAIEKLLLVLFFVIILFCGFDDKKREVMQFPI